MTPRTWTDPDGHHWPITGHYCTECGLPLIPTNGPAHPLCAQPKGTKPNAK